MYSEPQKRPAANRANDEPLRRMLGGELSNCAAPMLSLSKQEQDLPPCNEGDAVDIAPSCEIGECPTLVHTPSLAMVYSPIQCWKNVLQPEAALAHGTLFADLILPLEVVEKNCAREVRTRS